MKKSELVKGSHLFKILHTSDWHLGHRLLDRSRQEEHAKFMDWLIELINDERINALVIAGDVFDSGSPPIYAERQYYQFLCKVSQTCCEHVIIVGGNHDSASKLNAPKDVLVSMNVHVMGGAAQNIEEEVLHLKNSKGESQAIVCAVPFLRDRDLRYSNAGESVSDIEKAIQEGIKSHYSKVASVARAEKDRHDIPIIATGHLYMKGSKNSDSERMIYVGNIGQVGSEVLESEFDYVALGHLHCSQKVKGLEQVRYSGSPIPLSFSESKDDKKVVLVEFEGRELKSINEISVPLSKKLVLIKGTMEEVISQIHNAGARSDLDCCYFEVQVKMSSAKTSIHKIIMDECQQKKLDVLALKVMLEQKENMSFHGVGETTQLSELKPVEVFEYLLDAKGVEEGQKRTLHQSFKELLSINHEAKYEDS